MKSNRIFKKSNVTDTQVKGKVKQNIQVEQCHGYTGKGQSQTGYSRRVMSRIHR